MSRSKNTKRWGKAPKHYKETKKRRRRAKEKQALKTGKETPKFKKTDTYDWL